MGEPARRIPPPLGDVAETGPLPSSAARAAVAHRSRDRVLVVEDHRVNRRILAEILTSSFEVAEATSGEEALAQATRSPPDLVLLDIMLPGIDGYETCRRFRADPRLRWTKVIFISARVTTDERIAGYEAGGDDYLTKPYDVDELLAKIRVHLRLKSAEEVDALKSDLLGLLSHETRTPLHHVLGSASLLLGEADLDADERRDLLNIIHRGGERLRKLLDKVLLIAELKGRPHSLDRVVSEVADAARAAASAVQDEAERLGIEVIVRSEGPTQAPIDVPKIRLALDGMLDNALRFSAPGHAVDVRVIGDETRVEIQVTDRGPGIDPEFLPHVFEEFASRGTSRETSGHGLSMALARHVAQAHYGGIGVESEPGAGATFRLWVPTRLERESLAPTRRRLLLRPRVNIPTHDT